MLFPLTLSLGVSFTEVEVKAETKRESKNQKQWEKIKE